MKNLEIQWRWLRSRIIRRRAQVALGLRITIAAILALIIAQLVHIPLPMWVVITAVILTQMSVGRSLKATADYFLGTVGGALYGGLIAIILPHETELTLLLVFALAVAPLALFAALKPNMNVLPITAIIVLLMPTMSTSMHVTPFWSAVYRVMEVGLGGAIGLAVSFLVLPAAAHRQVRQAAARALDLMARVVPPLLAGTGLTNDELHKLQDGIGGALVELNTVGAEAERERSAHLSRQQPSTGPICRTVLRLRHDLVMVGRTAGDSLPDILRERVAPRLVVVASAIRDYMHECSSALATTSEAPTLAPLEQALQAYEAEVNAVRQEGLTRELPAEAAEHFFAVGFVLEQMHKNLVDLQRVVTEWGPKLDEDDD